MQFNIQVDQKLDRENFVAFWEDDNPSVKMCYPDVKSKQDIEELFQTEYQARKVLAIAGWFLGEIPILHQIAAALSDVIGEDWQGIDQMDIYMGMCPVCPRDIDNNAFWVYYGGTVSDMRRICAHEMAHFLYFKKIKRLLHDQHYDTECPGFGWLLSEILNVSIVNDPRIQAIVRNREQGYFFQAGVPEEIAKKVQELWNPDKLLTIHEQARSLLAGYYR